MKQFKLHWLGGVIETIEGEDIADAYNKAGLSASALRALDYYEEITVFDYKIRFGGCPFCQRTVVVFHQRGRWTMIHHIDHDGQLCEGSHGIPQGVTK